jgi:hypothetical protein
MPGYMHWRNFTSRIVNMCGRMNLMTRRRSPSNTRGRTKEKIIQCLVCNVNLCNGCNHTFRGVEMASSDV